ncbi:alpha/beta hydrolase [Halomonas faecis]|uniref:alpha/beta hydrolase n=1 Tax=Halomonas faecis TaxID=1562110 RepID=UPI0013D37D24|nr:alpha/beta hydrolase [Halomonas faecis]
MILRIALGFLILLSACGSASEPPVPAQPTESAVRLETATGTLYGSLLLPSSTGPHPLVLLHAGSGPTDRNGNSALVPGTNNSLKLLAEALAARGIASVRYDKRGVAASAAAAPSESDLRFDTYVDDAAAWVRQLRMDPRFGTITLLGHSEGALIGMLAAKQARADAFISVAAPARRASDILREQLRLQLSAELWQDSERILSELEQGRTTGNVPPALASLFRSSVQPYLISWFRYVPTEEIQRAPGLALIVHGTTDVQVSPSEAEALKQARPDAELLIVEGMNHVLKMVPLNPARQDASYSDPSLPVAPLLVERVVGFTAHVQRLPRGPGS